MFDSIGYNVPAALRSCCLLKPNASFNKNFDMENKLDNTTKPQHDVKLPVSCSAKMTFGLTGKNLEVIKKYASRWEGAEFDRDTWIRVGEEIGWEPLTACLWYFRKHYS